MDDEDYIYLKLHCADCSMGDDCSLWPHGALMIGKEGCTRRITEDERIQFYHYMEEVAPLLRTYKTDEARRAAINEIEDFLYNTIYCKPAGCKIDKDGKTISRSFS